MTTCEATRLSAYDEAVPHPAPQPAIAGRFAQLRRGRPAADLGALRDVVLVVSSSRGGSSMLAEILRRHRGLLSLPGEMNPYVVLAQLAGGDGDIVRAELARDIGRPGDGAGHCERDRLVNDVQFRLALQWPTLALDRCDVERAVVAAMADVDPSEEHAFTRAVLAGLCAAGVTAAMYDAADTPAVVPEPPLEPVVEMAPYVGFRQWRAPTTEELGRCPLVIATPRNSFRLMWLRQMFPAARLRVVHLTRNPAAAVNGLLDGWHHAGFFTTTVPEPLRIDGYSDVYPWASRWWKYDVPPHWRDLVTATLPVVAAEQWRAAHVAILEFCERTDTDDADVLRVRYEDVVGSVEQRREVAHLLANFLAVDEAEMAATVVEGISPVMATATPAWRRWSRSRHDLAPALAEPAVWELAARLGYDVDERSWI